MPMSGANKTRVLLRVPDETAEWIGREADRYGISRNAMMLIALEQWRRQCEMQSQLPGIIDAANKMAELDRQAQSQGRPMPRIRA